MIKTLFIVQNNPVYRDQRVMSEIRSVQKYLNSSIFVISPRFNNLSHIENPLKNITIYEYPCFEAAGKFGQIVEYSISAFFIFLISNFLIVKNKIDVVHIANPPDFLILLLPSVFLRKTKIIYDQHDFSLEIYNSKSGNPKSILNRFIYDALSKFEVISYRLCHSVIFPNDNVQKYYYSKVKKIKRNEIVRNGITENYVDLLADDKVIQDCRTNSKTFKIVYIGIITRESGVDNLITIANELKYLKVNFTFEIYGEGSYFREFKNNVFSTNLSEFFNFRGFQKIEEIIPIAQFCQIGIVPLSNNSKNNLGTARKVYEYMVMGLPVISLRLNEIYNVLDGSGFFCNDFLEMACKIKDISEKREYLFKMGKRNQTRFLQYYSWETQEKRLVDIYQNLLEREDSTKDPITSTNT